MKAGDNVRAIKMSDDSFYKQVEGKITEIKNGFATIEATRVMSKWSTEWEDHPSFCTTAARIENVVLLNQKPIVSRRR